jgi:hypothetical protein
MRQQYNYISCYTREAENTSESILIYLLLVFNSMSPAFRVRS